MSKNDLFRDKQEKRIKLYNDSIEKYLTELSVEVKNERESSSPFGEGVIAGAIIGSTIPIIGTIFGAIIGGALSSFYGKNRDAINDEIDKEIGEKIDLASNEVSEKVGEIIKEKIETSKSKKVTETDVLIINSILAQQNELFSFIKEQSNLISKLNEIKIIQKLKDELLIMNNSYSKMNSLLIRALINDENENNENNEKVSDIIVLESNVQELVSRIKIEEALILMLDFFKSQENKELLSTVIILLSRYRVVKMDKIKGVISLKDHSHEMVKINSSIFNLIEMSKGLREV